MTLAAPENRCEVAVIIPTYNCASHLAEAIESVLAQMYRHFCIYVIDDGSTDATSEVMRRYAGQCVYLWQPNVGCASARNHGIRVSSSKYIAFLDADDLWHPTKLERQISILEQQADVGLVASDFSIVEPDRTIDSFFAQHAPPPDGRIFESLLDWGMATPSIVVRRAAIEDVGMFNESLVVCEDMNLWLRIAVRWKIVIVREVLTTVRQRQGSLSATNANTIVSLRAGLMSFQHIESSCPDLLPREKRALRRKLALFYDKSGSSQLTNGTGPIKAARHDLAMALRYEPFRLTALAKLVASFLPASALSFLVGLNRKAFR